MQGWSLLIKWFGKCAVIYFIRINLYFLYTFRDVEHFSIHIDSNVNIHHHINICGIINTIPHRLQFSHPLPNQSGEPFSPARQLRHNRSHMNPAIRERGGKREPPALFTEKPTTTFQI